MTKKKPPNLYDDLGVSRDATAADIKRAYKRKAKTAHPDAGGSPEAFERLSRARAVLTDQRAREQYDRTGEVNAPEPDNKTARGLAIISSIVGAILSEEAEPPPGMNLVTRMAAIIQGERDEGEKELARLGRLRKRAERLAKRIKAKPGKADLVAGLFTARVDEFARAEAIIKEKLEITATALAILAGHTDAGEDMHLQIMDAMRAVREAQRRPGDAGSLFGAVRF